MRRCAKMICIWTGVSAVKTIQKREAGVGMGDVSASAHARIRLLPGDKETSDQSDFSVFVIHDSDIADIETGSV